MPYSGTPFTATLDEIIDSIFEDLQGIDGTTTADPEVNLVRDPVNPWKQIIRGNQPHSKAPWPRCIIHEADLDSEKLLVDLHRHILRLDIIFWVLADDNEYQNVSRRRNLMLAEIRRVLLANPQRLVASVRRAYDTEIVKSVAGDNSFGEKAAGGLFTVEVIFFSSY